MIGYELQVTTAGAHLVTPQEASDYLNLDIPEAELYMLITAVQEKAEAYCARSFTTKTLQLKIDGIGADGVLRLPRGPVTSITSVSTLDEDDAATVISSSTYYLADTERLIFTSAPDVQRSYGGLVVVYVAGGSPAPPDSIKVGMLKALSTIFEHREDFVVGGAVAMLPEGSKTFFDTWRAVC